jgi:hypothetical protein
VEDDLAAVGVDAVLEEVDALPGAEDQAAVEDGDGELDLGEGGFEVGGHVVEAFVVVNVGTVVGGDVVEVGEDVALYGGVGVLLDEERGGGVAAEDGEQAGVDVLVGDPVVERRGELVEALAAGGEGEVVGCLFHEGGLGVRTGYDSPRSKGWGICSVSSFEWKSFEWSLPGVWEFLRGRLVGMLGKLYAKWMYAWELALTTRDTNRVERPLEWGFDHLGEFGEPTSQKRDVGHPTSGRDDKFEGELARMIALNQGIVADPHAFFDYATPTDFRLEMHHPELYPTNVRPETLEQEREWKRRAAVGELRREPFLRFTSAVKTPYAENNVVNARWYPAEQSKGKPKQAMIVMPQWNADAFSHNALCEIFNRFGISCLRLSKPYHDVRRPAELERSDYAVSANVGRTIAACRQAVVDIRSCMDWLNAQGYEQIGVLGTSLGSAYAFIAAAMDARLRVCAFNHASTQFGDVVWTGQSTRHVKAAFEHAGLTQDEVRAMFAGVSPMSYMEQFAANRKRALVVYAPYDLTFIEKYSLDVLKNFDAHGVDYVAKVLPCGHYTTGETPYKYLDGWYMGSFVYQSFKRLAAEG